VWKKSSKKSPNLKITWLSQTQLRVIYNDFNKHVHWPDEDITKAICLFSVSASAYNYVRDVMKYPLPCQRTLYYWLSKIEVRPGQLITPVLRVLKSEFHNSSALAKVAVIAFDEVSIDPRYCYDKKTDTVRGGEDNSCVTAVRGLFYKWKQIIHFDFGKILCREELMNVIRILYSAEVDVRALTTDMGPKNQRIWKDLEIAQVKGGHI